MKKRIETECAFFFALLLDVESRVNYRTGPVSQVVFPPFFSSTCRESLRKKLKESGEIPKVSHHAFREISSSNKNSEVEDTQKSMFGVSQTTLAALAILKCFKSERFART